MASSVFTRRTNLHFCQLYNKPFLELRGFIFWGKEQSPGYERKTGENKIGIQPRVFCTLFKCYQNAAVVIPI